MKKTIRLFAIFVVLFSTVTLMSSCKKDVSNLPGTWKVISATIDGDSEDDLKDEWIFFTEGICQIKCDFDEYFDDNIFIAPEYDVINFNGTYTTDGNKRLIIKSDKFHQLVDEYYEQIVYDLDIDLLNKKNMIVDGTITWNRYEGNISNTKTAKIALSLAKR